MSQPPSAGDDTTGVTGAGGSAGGGPIPTLRETINQIDSELLALLAQRRDLSGQIAQRKARDHSPVRDQKREGEILGRLIRKGKECGLDAHFVTRIFHEIIEDSLRVQQEYLQRLVNREDSRPEVIRVAFQGIEGSYSHLAAQNFFAKDVDRLVFSGFNTFAEVVRAVEDGQADYAMLPVENTTSGSINEVYDLLLHTRLHIVGEEKYRVRHCLVGAKEVPLAALRLIYSHPQAVAQCRDFLSALSDCKVEYYIDTAMSVAKIKEEKDDRQAAVASEEAAEMYGLHIIKRDIANQSENYTRFLVASRNRQDVDRRIPCKTTIVMATSQEAGSLAEAMLVFRDHGVNLTKIESRPILGNPWEEMFYLDFEGNILEDRVKHTIDDLTKKTRFIKILGCYPSRDLPPTSPPPEAIAGGHKGAEAGTAPSVPRPETAPSATAQDAAAYRLASRTHKPEDTVIDVKGVQIGGGNFLVIAGPCSVESYEQIMSCAREVKGQGGRILRGSCFNAPASRNGFHGLGYDGLDLLLEAGRTYGLPVVTEVLSTEEVQVVAKKVDILQLGPQNMQNFTMLKEVGRMHRPVLLKRGLVASIDELLLAAECILEQGNQQVVLCERGIRTFETAYKTTLDLPAIPVLKSRTHLPVFVDPSHAAGDSSLVLPLAKAAKAIGADGIMVEIHPEPEKALGEGAHLLDYPAFENLMSELFR